MLSGLLLAAAVAAAAPPLTIEGIDVYGTTRLTADDAKVRYGKALGEVARTKSRRTKVSESTYPGLLEKIGTQIRKEWKFAWTKVSWHDLYSDGKLKGFVTIDVVEPGDQATRLAFRKAPTGNLPDPGGLLAAWDQYMSLGWSLFKQGQLSVTHDACLSYFCEWGGQTPELKAFEELFIAHAGAHKDALVQVLKGDKSPGKRANAAYLLAYLPDPNETARLIADALDDPEPDVRGAALRVYADYAVHHKDVVISAWKIQSAIDFPTADDRKKAMAVIAGMASNPSHKRFLITKLGKKMVELLDSQLPGMGDTAWAALGILSGESYDRRDTVSWGRWLERAVAQQAETPDPSPKTP